MAARPPSPSRPIRRRRRGSPREPAAAASVSWLRRSTTATARRACPRRRRVRAARPTPGPGRPWRAATNYNVYKQKGSIYGFVAQVSAATWTDANLDPDIGNTPPQQRNPFGATKITAVSVSNGGAGYSAPSVQWSTTPRARVPPSRRQRVGRRSPQSMCNSQGQDSSPNAALQVSDGNGSGASIQLQLRRRRARRRALQIGSATVLAGGRGLPCGGLCARDLSRRHQQQRHARLTVLGRRQVTACAVTNPGYGFAPTFPFPYAQVYDAAGSGAVLVPTADGRRHDLSAMLDLLHAAPGLCRHAQPAADPVVHR